MLSLFQKSKSAFGLDISGNSFKIVQLEHRGGNLAVKAYANTPLSKNLIINDTITDSKTLNYLIKQTLDKPQFGQIGTNFVVASLPESKSFVRVIQIPKMSDAEAESAVPFEAESFIPLPVDQVYLDWQKLSDAGEKMNILIIASPRDFVDQYLNILEGAGLRVAALEVESQSCHRALVGKNSQETMLIVDLDAYRSSLIMVEEGNLQFTSSVPIAGNAFTESIATALGVSSTKAEEIKKKVGIANTTTYPNVKTALLPVLNNLSGEIKSILKFHSEHSDKQVARLVLAGGSAKLKNLVEFLAPQMTEYPGLKIELGNPWQNLPRMQQSPLSPEESLNFTTAIGLAMRGTDYIT
jgi:type IV pilus assembly protein PilM